MKPSWSLRRTWNRVVAGFCLGALVTGLSWSQIPRAASRNQPASEKTAEQPQDLLGRTTPRGTVLGFLTAANEQQYETAVQYLDTRAHGKEAAMLAKQLFLVLDRRLPAHLNNLSNEPLGSRSDLLDPRRELIGSVATSTGTVDIFVERIDRPNNVSIWLFSRETLADIPDVYDEINSVTIERYMPDYLLRKYFGLTLFAWAFFLLFLPLLYFFLSVLNRLTGAGVGFALRHWYHRPDMGNLTILPHPLRLLILSATVFWTLHVAGFSLLARQLGSTIGSLLLIVSLVWAMFLVFARCESFLKKRMERQGRLSATAVLRPCRRLMDVLAIIVGLIFLLHSLGINPSAALAGLGVGGIAIALAAQKTLENVIGGASLIMDDAVRVGDFFRIGDVRGTVEVIGLRSTRVRTLDRTLVTIPNGQMATMTLENFSARDQFWLRQVISVDHQTTPSALNSLLAAVKAMLEQDPRVLPASTRVRFLRIAESNLELEVVAYIYTRDGDKFLEIQEDILMRIREAICSAGIEFAYPAHTIYLKNETAIGGTFFEPLRQETGINNEAVRELEPT